jgi:hypothetical protein
MKNLVFLLFLGLVIFLVTGWFMDWYSFTGAPSENGKTTFQFEIDRSKIQQDFSKGKEKFDKTLDALEKPSSSAASKTTSDPWVWK